MALLTPFWADMDIDTPTPPFHYSSHCHYRDCAQGYHTSGSTTFSSLPISSNAKSKAIIATDGRQWLAVRVPLALSVFRLASSTRVHSIFPLASPTLPTAHNIPLSTGTGAGTGRQRTGRMCFHAKWHPWLRDILLVGETEVCSLVVSCWVTN